MKIGIIGFGNLGRSLASGLIMSDCVNQGELFVCESSEITREIAQNEPFYAHATADVNDVISASEIVFLTVKSYVFEELSRIIDRRALQGKTIISFMAGVPFEKIYSLIGDVNLVRAMPSLAIASCEGVIGYTKTQPDIAEIFHKLGYAFETEPENIERVMAFSACGLGFAAYLVDAFCAAGVAMGFSQEVSTQIASMTFKNAVDRGNYRDTVNAVATKGGATEAGILYMNSHEVYNAVANAVQKAYEKMT